MSDAVSTYGQRMFRKSTPVIGRNVEIDDEVSIGPGTVIHDNVTIRKGTSIGPNVVIGEPVIDAYKSSRYENLPTLIERGSIIRAGTVIYAGCSLGPNAATGHYAVLRERTVCGEKCSFGTYCSSDGDLKIGDRCRFSYYTHVCKSAEIGDDVWMFPLSQLYNDMHPPCNECMEGPRLCNRVIVGSGAIILPKVRIGEDAVIAAGSLVTRDVPDKTFVVGSPARVVGLVTDIRCKTGKISQPYPWKEHYVRPR